MTPRGKKTCPLALSERVKELTCLYSIAQLCSKPTASLPEILQSIAESLPCAWGYPEHTAARIILDGREYCAGRPWRDGPCLKAMLVIRGSTRGSIQVAYVRRTPKQFADEERRLLMEAARQVSLLIDRRETAAEQERLHAKLRHAERLATLGQFAAGVAHELNEPLGAILGFAQLVAKTPRIPKTARSDLAKIETSALHAREIIRHLLAFARQAPPRETPVDINQIIRDHSSIWQARCEAEGVQLELALDENMLKIVADGNQLQQVITILVVNAVQAMPEGGILRINTHREEQRVRLTVSDTGIGIPQQNLARIFDPFFTTKEIDQGTGLGLAVAHGIISGHQGKITVKSVPGHGTIVTVVLPIRQLPAGKTTSGDDHGKSQKQI